MALEYFPCYHSYARKIAKLSDQEVGRLFRALLTYSETGEAQELTGREAVAYDFIADDIARAKEAYSDTCKKNRENIQKRYDRIRSNTTEYECYQTKDKTKSKDKTKGKDEEDTAATPPSPAPARRCYGEYGWVKLTDEEYQRLLNDMGQEELTRCIDYINESAQSNGNKNRWKDWNLVIRRCHRDGWGLRRKEDAPGGDAGGCSEQGTWNGYEIKSAI